LVAGIENIAGCHLRDAGIQFAATHFAREARHNLRAVIAIISVEIGKPSCQMNWRNSSQQRALYFELHLEQMRNAITVRLPDELAEWLASTATETGVSQGKIIREQLEKARTMDERPFLRLAGRVSASPSLSERKGFSKR
jgi:hypothetical protein